MSCTHKIQQLIEAGALFAVNHSAGKDSQAMLIRLRGIGVPDSQMVIIHADLGEVEWAGNLEHIKRWAGDIPIIIARARRELLEMVEDRGMWPSPKFRQCTSDLKRGPIERELRRYLKARPRFKSTIVNCMGMRAEESPARAKQKTFKRNDRNSKAGRAWYDWLPIHSMTKKQVFGAITRAGQTPHWAYAKGMSRLSCAFCIMASKSDLTTAANLRPELFAKYVALEKRIGHTLSMSGLGLEAVTGVSA